MEGLVNVNEFMNTLEDRGLVIAPKHLVKNALEENRLRELRRRLLAKKALTFKEISDCQVWGAVTTRAVKAYAEKYTKPLEIFAISDSPYAKKKVIIAAVERLAKQRGYGHQL